MDNKIKEILVDLQVEESKGEEAKIPKLLERDIDILIGMDESSQLEFKSTFQWDIKLEQKNIDLRNEVLKTIAAFNNTEGGYLIIGIDDNKNIFGLEKDYSLSKKQNKDVFLQTLIQEIENCDFINAVKRFSQYLSIDKVILPRGNKIKVSG